MAEKTKKTVSSNVLYLSDVDAKALGLVEGTGQKVFVDGKEVKVVYVDEHEIIPATEEERKLYKEANEIRSRYVGTYQTQNNPLERRIVSSEYGYEEKPGFWAKLFGKSYRSESPEDVAAYEAELQKRDDAEKARIEKTDYYVKNDVFTRADLEKIQAIIDRAKNKLVETPETTALTVKKPAKKAKK